MEMKLKTDSRQVCPGDTFIAIENVARDGHDYINQAIENGATRIICQRGHYDVETVIVEDTRAYLKDYLVKHYYPMIEKMRLIGVTGTNGKTTICFLIYQMLQLLNHPCGYMGTIGFYLKDEFMPLNNTTPDVDILYQLLMKAYEAHCQTMIMEVSSHAIGYDRIHGLMFDQVAFTNLTQDHLDFHKTMDHYLMTKQQLFHKTRGDKIAIINGDDPYGKDFVFNHNHNIIISDHDGDLIIKDIEFTHLGTHFTFEYQNKSYTTSIAMVGRYNVYNYLMALLQVIHLGYDVETVLALNSKLKAPSGRMELITYRTNGIFVDFAHTPDAIVNVLQSAKEFKKGRVITVMGCGGDRDPTKRPLMAKAASENSDFVIMTSDNPRSEDPQAIIDDMIPGLVNDNYQVFIDRHDAIYQAMEMLEENDILMLLGKGHEDYQVMAEGKVHFSDQEEVHRYIEEHA